MKIDHVVQALEGYVPAGLHGIQLKPPTDSRIGWEDVGGLDQPKKLLIEILKWPTQVYKLTYSINFFLESHCQLLFCSVNLIDKSIQNYSQIVPFGFDLLSYYTVLLELARQCWHVQWQPNAKSISSVSK